MTCAVLEVSRAVLPGPQKKAPPFNGEAQQAGAVNTPVYVAAVLFNSLKDDIREEDSGQNPCDNRNIFCFFSSALCDYVRDDTE